MCMYRLPRPWACEEGWFSRHYRDLKIRSWPLFAIAQEMLTHHKTNQRETWCCIFFDVPEEIDTEGLWYRYRSREWETRRALLHTVVVVSFNACGLYFSPSCCFSVFSYSFFLDFVIFDFYLVKLGW